MSGYKTINFNDTNLEATNADGVAIAGIYSAIENSYRKALMLIGVVIDGVEKNSVYAEPTHNDNEYTFNVYGHTITVSNLDVVKITA